MNITDQSISSKVFLLDIAIMISKTLNKSDLKIFENLIRYSSSYLEVYAILQYYLQNKEE